MDDKKCKVTVTIFGEAYPLKGDMDSNRALRSAEFLDSHMKKIANANRKLSTGKVAILAALNIVDEFLQLEQDYQQLLQMIREEKR